MRQSPPAGGAAAHAIGRHNRPRGANDFHTIQYNMNGAAGAGAAGDFDTVTKCETISVKLLRAAVLVETEERGVCTHLALEHVQKAQLCSEDLCCICMGEFEVFAAEDAERCIRLSECTGHYFHW